METLSRNDIILKTVIVHTVSYFIIGFMAYTLADYTTMFGEPVLRDYMRPTDEPLVRAGILFQPIRGVLFGLVFYTLRDVYFSRTNGWQLIWLALVILGIFSTFGPTPGSIEGFVYTRVPLWLQLKGLPEILVQSFLLAYVTHYWVLHPDKKWLGRILWLLFVIVLLMALATVFFQQTP